MESQQWCNIRHVNVSYMFYNRENPVCPSGAKNYTLFQSVICSLNLVSRKDTKLPDLIEYRWKSLHRALKKTQLV